jgi:hypothetical protein
MISGRGAFFQIDRRTWQKVCSLGLNPAVSYLVMASGTGGDNRTTSWSTNSIENYTGIGRGPARRAIEQLIAAKIIMQTQGGTKPRYSLQPANLIPGCEGSPPELATSDERRLLTSLAPRAYIGKRDRNLADGLVAKRLARWTSDNPGHLELTPPYNAEAAETPDWIWLPNSLVIGAEKEIPPVERLRRRQDVRALQMLVELYHSQSLADSGGLHWRLIRTTYVREKLTERGPWTIWGFKSDNTIQAQQLPAFLHWRGEGFWEVWKAILGAGLLECVPHLVEADTAEAGTIHPCPIDNRGTDIEQRLGLEAATAADELLGETMRHAFSDYDFVLPVSSDFPMVELVGIYRLRYRARTAMTGAWFAQQAEYELMANALAELAANTIARREGNHRAA